MNVGVRPRHLSVSTSASRWVGSKSARKRAIYQRLVRITRLWWRRVTDIKRYSKAEALAAGTIPNNIEEAAMLARTARNKFSCNRLFYDLFLNSGLETMSAKNMTMLTPA